MTKEQIYIELGYTGTYTKEVKRRLRLLIKKYHPAVYHKDDTVMKLLNQVREEIESKRVDTVFYQKPSRPVVEEEVLAEEDFFFEITIEQLQKKIDDLKKKQVIIYENIKKLNKEINNLYQQFVSKMEKYEESKLNIEELQKKKQNHFTMILTCTIISILLFSILSIANFSYIFIALIVLTFISFLIYCYSLYKKVTNLNKEISRGYANKNTYFNEAVDAKERVDSKEYERLKEETQYHKRADDIQLYYYEMSKKHDSKTIEKKRNYQK